MAEWKKGMKVFLKRNNYGSREVTVDYRYKYQIRSIGAKQAIVDMIQRPEEERRYNRYGRKGDTHRLTSPARIQRWREDHPGETVPTHYYQTWSDIFVPAGDGNWDAEENYAWS